MLDNVWNEFLRVVGDEVGNCVVETWFKAVSISRWDKLEGVVYLSVPNAFVSGWIKTHYMQLLQVNLGRLLSATVSKVIFLDQSGKEDSAEPPEPEGKSCFIPIVPATTTKPSRHRKVPARRDHQESYSHINNRYQFESFIVGPSNSLAYAAARAVTEKPGRLYNPLFIYGKSGLGKTHLLHAIGNSLKAKNRGTNVLYQTANRFVNEFISAIRFDKMDRFQLRYKDVDVLLVDDVQFISNKEQTQEAFFHVFNSLYDNAKQIVFSGDVFPRNIEGIAERLRSRLEWGLVTDILLPSHETKVAILRNKAEQSGEPVTDDVLHYIALHSVSNIRELEGALIRVVAFATLTKQPVSIDVAKKVITRSDDKRKPIVDFGRILRYVSQHFAHSVDEIKSSGRGKEIVRSRQMAMYLMKTLTDRSFREIGVYLRRKDHTTVVHAVNKVKELAETESDFSRHLDEVKTKIIESVT